MSSTLTNSLARDVLHIMQDKTPTNYCELSIRLGKTRNQLARAIKYLRSEGYVFRTVSKGGHYSADLQYISGPMDMLKR